MFKGVGIKKWRTLTLLTVLAAVLIPLRITAARAQKLIPISVRMDWVISGYHAPFFVGVKKGFYKDEGLDVTVEPGNGSGIVTQAIGNGNGNFAAVDGGTMMTLVSKGLAVKAVMGILQRSPLAIIYNASIGIKAPKDLEGKKIGVTNGEAPLLLLPAFLKATDVDRSKITLVNTDPASKNAIMLAGQVDAVLNFNFLGVPPLEEKGLKVGTFNYADYGINVPGLSLIANDSYLKANGPTTKKFIRATVKAYEWSIQHPKQAIDILIDSNPGQKISRKLALRVLTLSFNLLHTNATKGKAFGVMAKSDWAEAENLLVKYEGIRKAASPDVYFTNDYLPH